MMTFTEQDKEKSDSKMKAFAITINGFNETGYYCGGSAGKARYAAFLNVSEAWPDIKIIDIKVRRSPQYDHVAQGRDRSGFLDVMVYELQLSDLIKAEQQC